ncbi:ankyrin repeat domain-containing protein [Ralstonia nicotianae]
MKLSLIRWQLPLLAALMPFCAAADEAVRCPSVATAEPRDAATQRQFNQAAQRAPRLFRAILANDMRAAQRYLAQGDDPNACALGASLLSQAVGQGRTEIAERLIHAGANLEHPLSAAGETVLLHAIGEAQWGPAMDLVIRGANVKAEVAGTTPLLAASTVPVRAQSTQAREQLDLVRLLLTRGASVNAQAPDGSPSLMLAVRNGNTALIRLLLFFGADPLLRNRNGIHALELAQEAKRADIESLLAPYCVDKAPVAELMETGRNDELISLLAKTDASKMAQPARQALLVAALFQHNLPAVGLLANWGADPNGVMGMIDGADQVAMTPLQVAIGYDGDSETLEALVRAGANPNGTVAFDDSEPPLLMSLTRHNIAAARTLLRLGADPNRIRAAGDMSALMNAVALASLPELDNPLGLVRQLLDSGADVNAVGPHGMTALHMAAIDGNTETARLLLAHGADPNVRDEQHKTALDYARKGRSAEVLALLKPLTQTAR